MSNTAASAGRRAGDTSASAQCDTTAPALATTLRELIVDGGHPCSIGGYGALAEFHDTDAEAWDTGPDLLTLISRRGALRLDTRRVSALCAWELLSAHAARWQCGVGLLAPAAQARGATRRVLTELGRDHEAVQAEHRTQLLFDLGAGLPHADFLVRTAEPMLVALLRRHAGTRVTTAGHPLLEAIIDAGPHRVVCSVAARIEVYQPIDRQHTPCGPHTHLLPALLGRRHSQAAGLPYPADHLPVLTLHPENPLVDADGAPRPFDREAWQRFELLLARHGDATYVAEKRRLAQAVERGMAPHDYHPPQTRLGRLARRIALRQLVHTLPDAARCHPWSEHTR